MTTYNPRPIANLPQHASSRHTQQQHPSQSHPHRSQPQAPPPRMPIQSVYNPTPAELHPGARNRLFLALRSGIESEVDWALPRLVLASFDHAEVFRLDAWPDSVNALMTYPLKWLEELEKESALYSLRNGLISEEGLQTGVLGLVTDWTRDMELESRAIKSLLVLRNASFSSTNAKSICRAPFIDLIARFFSLPVEYLLETSMRQPEPIQHLFVLVQSTFPYIRQSTLASTSSTTAKGLMQAFSKTLPEIVVQTRDAGILHNLLPILIVAYQIPTIQPPPPSLIPHLLKTLTLSPPQPLLEYSVDLLISLTQNSTNTRAILADRDFPAHLRNMVRLLERGAKKTSATWEAPGQIYGMIIPNPASIGGQLEQAAKKRKVDRENAQKLLQSGNTAGVVVEVGDRPPFMSVAAKSKLLAMPEPDRAIHWMHENFVYSSTSSVLQVTFWHAYRDFFTSAAPQDPMLSASEVIKNVTVAFPCASPKVLQDPTGNKFVIWGLGWRKGSDDTPRFTCHWDECPTSGGHSDAVRLLDHVRSTHLGESSTTCAWGTCRHSPLTLSHICTHLPLANPIPVAEQVTIHPSSSLSDDPFRSITHRPAPPLSRHYKLHFTGSVTDTDSRRHPIGVTYLASLLLRNIARTLRSDLSTAFPEAGLTQEAKAERKRHLQEERFGLPIPDTVLKEEEEEEKEVGSIGEAISGVSQEELERARFAFESVEERVLEVVEGNMSGLSQFLGECYGFGAFGGW